VNKVIRQANRNPGVVQFAKNDSCQGMPLGVPQPVEPHTRFSGCGGSRRLKPSFLTALEASLKRSPDTNHFSQTAPLLAIRES
jgi:hypothetical protein